MSDRRRLARERLEYYLVYLILAYRRLILIAGLFFLTYAVMTLLVNRIAGFTTLLPAIFLLLLGNSYNAAVYTARLGAWIGTLWIHEEGARRSCISIHRRQCNQCDVKETNNRI